MAMVVLWGRLFQVQYLGHDHYRKVAVSQRTGERQIPAARGTIYDRNGRPLAVSASLYSVALAPPAVKNAASVAANVARALGVSRRRVKELARSDRNFVWVKRQVDLSPQQLEALTDLDGVVVNREPGRVHPYGDVATKLLGFCNVDNKGMAGIEAAFQSELMGRPGRASQVKNGRYRADRYYESVLTDAVDGRDVYLTIDVVVQEIAEQRVAQAVRKHGATSGAAIVLDVRTGDLLALAEYPSPRWENTADSLWTMRSVSHVYEPGSTFKLVTSAALLESGSIDIGEQFDAENGKADLGYAVIADPEPHGVLSFSEAFAHSSNIVLSKASQRLSSRHFYNTIRLFGFCEKTGVQLNGESAGFLAKTDDWSNRTKGTLAFGQEIAVTPLQMINAFAAVANGGELMVPRLVLGMADTDGDIERINATRVRRVVSPRTADVLRDLCVGVVAEGTGDAAALGLVSTAGKTGTAQKAKAGRYIYGKYVSSFVGFAPVDEPRIAVLVMLDEPRYEARYGSISAAPAFAEICRGIANSTELFDDVLAEPLRVAEFDDSGHAAPNFLRMSRENALEFARKHGINVLCNGAAGRVAEQQPAPGVQMGKDDVVRLVVRSESPSAGIVPRLQGLAMREAKTMAARNGFTVRFVGSGWVRRQSPSPGTQTRDAEITVYCGEERALATTGARGSR